ncbi:MAG: hypothetical protein MUF18_21755 [Fimbriiglobus sp.]|jgi:hypothetical protein|nr:hypothetical protein [Fimbriiglobus sp.]
MPPNPAIAVLIRGAAADAAVTVRAVRSTADRPHAVYLLLDPDPPAEAFNRAAAVRSEPFLLFLEAGVVPAGPGWLGGLLDALSGTAAAAVCSLHGGSRLCGLLTRADVFDRLGGFDVDRAGAGGHLEDYLARLIGHGYECVAPSAAVFLAGHPQLRKAG